MSIDWGRPGGRVIYRERSPWPLWVGLLFWGVILGVLAAGWTGDVGPIRGWLGYLVYTAALLGIGAFVWTFLAGLTVEVTQDGVGFGLGNGRLVRGFVSFAELDRVESVTYHPLREFGGWGLRVSGTKTAWTAPGDEAVVLHLANGRQVFVGTANASRLEERIRTTLALHRRT